MRILKPARHVCALQIKSVLKTCMTFLFVFYLLLFYLFPKRYTGNIFCIKNLHDVFIYILFIIIYFHKVTLELNSTLRTFMTLCALEVNSVLTHSCPPFQHLLSERLMSLGIMGDPRVPPLKPSETIVL